MLGGPFPLRTAAGARGALARPAERRLPLPADPHDTEKSAARVTRRLAEDLEMLDAPWGPEDDRDSERIEAVRERRLRYRRILRKIRNKARRLSRLDG
jgi:hypothetical protein